MLIKKRNKGKKNGGLMYIKHIQTDYKIYTHICTSCKCLIWGGKKMQCIYLHRYYWSSFSFHKCEQLYIPWWYSRTQGNSAVYYTVLHPYPRFNRERLLSDFYNSSSSGPVSIATITSMPSIAEPEFLIGAAPVQSMVMPNKYCLQQ